jgi:hypothetical protein
MFSSNKLFLGEGASKAVDIGHVDLTQDVENMKFFSL